jgi:hypothetical protein
LNKKPAFTSKNGEHAHHRGAPKELILDVDASDIPLHGDQEKGEFHAYYDHYCYLPLYVFARPCWPACCGAAGSMAPSMCRR